VRLRDRDTILVRQQGPTVAALGAVRGVFRYEIEKPRTGEELIALARPLADATHVSLLGIRGGRPESFYFALSAFRSVPLRDGDIVTFSPDVPTGVMTVKLDGRIDGPTTLVVSRTATLLDVLAYVPVDTYFADTSSIYVRRLSVAQAQKKSIDDALHRLESAVVTSPTITAEQAQMRQQEAQIIFTFGKQLADVQPEGRLVVSYDGHLSNVRLEDGDVIVVPSRTDLVLISGEVRVPQSLVWIRGAPVGQYIETAGGFTERADTSILLVIRPSGQTIVGSNPPIQAGDRIIVLPSPSNWALPFIKDITQIIYQVAVGVGVLLRL
jgi:protein involved in polysaccharide export with SLBB domain